VLIDFFLKLKSHRLLKQVELTLTEEQKGRHQGGAKPPHRAGKLAQPVRREGLGPARVPQSRRFCGIGTRNIKVALRRLRKFAREGAAKSES
jgi:uncharacterized protein with von Willebrand factor type A (vWA) domain